MYRISHVEAIKSEQQRTQAGKEAQSAFGEGKRMQFFNWVRCGLCFCQAARQLSGDDLALLLKAKEKEKEEKEKEEQQEGTALEGAEAPAEAEASG